MKTKLSLVRDCINNSEWQQAIRIAAKFPHLREYRNAILDAHTAYTNPRFLIQIGKDIDCLKLAGQQALIAMYCA